jgi:hypothetical protein
MMQTAAVMVPFHTHVYTPLAHNITCCSLQLVSESYLTAVPSNSAVLLVQLVQCVLAALADGGLRQLCFRCSALPLVSRRSSPQGTLT